jgi:hypothetical protein
MNGSTTFAQMLSVTVINSIGLFVAVGNPGAPVYATSSDGSTWTTPATMGSGLNSTITSVAVNSSGLLVAVGYDYNNYPAYATSN